MNNQHEKRHVALELHSKVDCFVPHFISSCLDCNKSPWFFLFSSWLLHVCGCIRKDGTKKWFLSKLFVWKMGKYNELTFFNPQIHSLSLTANGGRASKRPELAGTKQPYFSSRCIQIRIFCVKWTQVKMVFSCNKVVAEQSERYWHLAFIVPRGGAITGSCEPWCLVHSFAADWIIMVTILF